MCICLYLLIFIIARLWHVIQRNIQFNRGSKKKEVLPMQLRKLLKRIVIGWYFVCALIMCVHKTKQRNHSSVFCFVLWVSVIWLNCAEEGAGSCRAIQSCCIWTLIRPDHNTDQSEWLLKRLAHMRAHSLEKLIRARKHAHALREYTVANPKKKNDNQV